MRQVEDLVAGRLDGGGDRDLGVGERFGGAGGGQGGHGSSAWLADRTADWSDGAAYAPRRGARLAQRSAESVASATTVGAMMNSAIGSSSSALEPQHDEDRHDEADPGRRGGWPGSSRPGRRSGGVARRRSARASGTRVSPTARPMSAAPTNPAPGSATGSRVVTTRPTSTQTTAAAAKNAEVGQPVARLHDERV